MLPSLPPPVEEHSNLLLTLTVAALGPIMLGLTWIIKRVIEFATAAIVAKLGDHDEALRDIRKLLGEEVGKLRGEIGDIHEKVNDVKDTVHSVSERTRALEEQVGFHLHRRKAD